MEAIAYLAERSEQAARRFRVQTEATFGRLAASPEIGTRYEPEDPAYAELRYFPIAKFPKYLAFYRPVPDGIEVVRVLHGARDIASILENDLGIPGGDDETMEPTAFDVLNKAGLIGCLKGGPTGLEGSSPGIFLEDEATGAPTELPRPGSMEASGNGSTTFAEVLAPVWEGFRQTGMSEDEAVDFLDGEVQSARRERNE